VCAGGGNILSSLLQSSHKATVGNEAVTDHSGGCSPGFWGHTLARWSAGGSYSLRLLL